MGQNNASMRFFYGTALGRALIKTLLACGLPKLMAAYLRSGASRGMIPKFIKKHNIRMDDYPQKEFRSFAEFFSRKKAVVEFDPEPKHLISPCDGWLSVYPIAPDSSFEIKGSNYRVCDLLGNSEIAEKFVDGLCLIFRLTPADYHRYSFIDDGRVGGTKFIEGALHCVQPIALEKFPVFRLNRRNWTLLETVNFGPVAQIEVGAMAVGGIVNDLGNGTFKKGQEMGRFELCGSTIVQLFAKDKIELLSEIVEELAPGLEYQVKVGSRIGTAK